MTKVNENIKVKYLVKTQFGYALDQTRDALYQDFETAILGIQSLSLIIHEIIDRTIFVKQREFDAGL